MSQRIYLRAIAGVAVAVCMMAANAQAQVSLRSDRAVYFTFSQPVALPQVTLPPGRYLFRLADSQTTRNVVQIYSADGQRLHGMMMTLPTQRPTPTDNAEIRFIETASGSATPVRSYWYPGLTTGWEFIYPREQALTLARAANTTVLTTEENVSGDAMRSADVVRVDASGRNVAVDSDASEPSGVAARGEIADDAPAAAPSPAAAPAATPAPSGVVARAEQGAGQAPARTALPQTASSLPTVFAAGIVAALMALGLGLVRRSA